MKKIIVFAAITIALASFLAANIYAQDSVIIIRHGEKPADGDNLNCMGFNRSLGIPAVLSSKFSIPSYVYVPSLDCGKATKHSRMFQTVTPFAVQYNLTINSKHGKSDTKDLAKAVTGKLGTKGTHGTILIVWEHKNIKDIATAMGVKNVPSWPDDDFDSIWIITNAGTKNATRDTTSEGLNGVSTVCP